MVETVIDVKLMDFIVVLKENSFDVKESKLIRETDASTEVIAGKVLLKVTP